MADGISVLAGLGLVVSLTDAAASSGPITAGAIAAALFYVVAGVTGLYRNWRGVSLQREIGCLAGTWLGALLALKGAGFFLGSDFSLPRNEMLLWAAATPLLAVAARLLARQIQRQLRARGYNTRGAAIVGVNGLGLALAESIEQSPHMGLVVEGFYDDRPAERTGNVPEDVGRRVGDLDELVRQARDGSVRMIYIALPMRAEDRIRGVLDRLADTTASVHIVPDFFVFEMLHARWNDIGGLPVVSVFESPFYGVDGLAKRVCDLVLASLALVMLALPMAVIALLIKRSSPGPVFFRQRRYGLDGREILVWKFRTMTVCEDGGQVRQATKGDSRVTAIGAVLRKTSLDELPQLFNVMAGSMSLVGPRPHASSHNEHYRGLIQGYMLRHKVRPGITGLAQVCGYRGETDTLEKMERRVEHDHRYIREWSLWLDAGILVRTVFVVLSRQNAY